MPLLSVLLLGTVTTTASASMLSSGFEIELPETIPAEPIYDEQTTVLVEAYCPGCFGDLDGDEVVTDEDFRLWVIAHMADRIEIIDVNSDGRLNVIDEVESVARFLDLLSGDLNADGQVNQQDLDLFMARYSNYSNDDLLYFNRNNPDMNLDGQVTQNDIDLFLARMANVTVPDRIEVAVDILANTIGTLTHAFYSGGHVMPISRTWEDHGHKKKTSLGPHWVPPNHDWGYSKEWINHTVNTSNYGNPIHGVTNSSYWPAAHWAEVSNQWYPGHNNANSKTEPANHSRAISTTWQVPGGHATTLSKLWPPDHAVNLSPAMGPAQHDGSFSAIKDLEGFPPESNPAWPAWPAMVPLWSPHLESWSGTWPAGHVTTISEAFYPPNHIGNISGTWRLHLVNISVQWPTNHIMAVSKAWPNDSVPNWPPNHGTSVSQEDSEEAEPAQPFQLPPLFPPGHSIYTTSQDLVPFLQVP